jgi:hypothetical protein
MPFLNHALVVEQVKVGAKEATCHDAATDVMKHIFTFEFI